MALLTEAGIAFAEVGSHRATLEEAYMELTRDSTEFVSAVDGEVTR